MFTPGTLVPPDGPVLLKSSLQEHESQRNPTETEQPSKSHVRRSRFQDRTRVGRVIGPSESSHGEQEDTGTPLHSGSCDGDARERQAYQHYL